MPKSMAPSASRKSSDTGAVTEVGLGVVRVRHGLSRRLDDDVVVARQAGASRDELTEDDVP